MSFNTLGPTRAALQVQGLHLPLLLSQEELDHTCCPTGNFPPESAPETLTILFLLPQSLQDPPPKLKGRMKGGRDAGL